MAILRLTEAKTGKPIRVNFDNVAYYQPKDSKTLISFMAPKYYVQTILVAESVDDIDRLLGL